MDGGGGRGRLARSLSLAVFDVVVVPFPYIDLPVEKRRPALVVSRPEMEAEHGWVWLAMITSAAGALKRGDAAIAELAPTGLTRPCRVRASKLVTLDRARVLRRAGALSPADRLSVARALKECAGW